MNSIVESAILDTSNKIAEHGLVVFAGAGVSADEPSRVPGWSDLNSMILETLKRRVTRYLIPPAHSWRSPSREKTEPTWLDQVIQGLVARRKAYKFPPEYQAQIMEEQCGETYFYALATLDVTQHNKSHTALAKLARAGHLRAVVTTNFDCLIERALAIEKVEFESFIQMDDFRRLHDRNLTELSAHRAIPVIKIHGSVKMPSSMIDTLQQRLVGRGELLADLLIDLLSRHVVLYVGFSAADLNHNPDYLGLQRSATSSPVALFVQYPGNTLEKGAKSLLDAYGEKAHHIEATLNDTFSRALAMLNLNILGEPAIIDPDSRGTVEAKLNNWAESLQPYEAINVLSALLDAGGEEEAAWTLLHHTWKSRLSRDSTGEHYARYQYNYANHCLLTGEMQYEETPQNFLRSQEKVSQSMASFALWNLYRARPEYFWDSLLNAKAKALDPSDPRLKGDLMRVLANAAIIYRWAESLDDLIEAGNYQFKIGDLPRALKLWAASARLAAQEGDLGTVNGLFNHCEHWFRYLGDDASEAEFYLAFAMASRKLGSVAMPILRRYNLWPLLIEALIEGVYYYCSEGQAKDALNLVVEANQRIAKGYEIYYPLLGIAVAEYHIGVKQWDRAKRELLKVRPLAENTNNSYAAAAIDGFLTRINESTGGGCQ
jgi:hypothetical protein